MKQWIKRNRAYIVLFGIFIVACILRFFHLGTLPSSFHEDEILSGYLGRYILENGVDLYGNKWPLLYFNKFGDFYIILPMYFSGIASYLFGVRVFATRFPTALFGSLSVFPLYAFSNWLFRSKRISLISAFFLAILPWHVVLSRSTTEGVIGCAIFLTALVFSLWFIEKSKKWYLFFSVVLFFISYFIYHPFRLYTPLVLAPLAIYCFIFKKKSSSFILILTTVLFFILTVYIGTTPWGKGRFIQTSIFSELSGVSIRIQQLIFDEGQQNIIIARIFHNKVIGYSREFISQYLSYLSPRYLFIDGWASDHKLSRYVVPEQGMIYLSGIFLIFIACISLARKKFEKKGWSSMLFFFYLTFISCIPAAFTVAESPNPHRSLFLGLLLCIFLGYGFYSISLLWKKSSVLITSFFIVILFGEFIFFWHNYSAHANNAGAPVRNDGQKELAFYIKNNLSSYNKIVVPVEGAMAWYYLFFTKDFNIRYSKEFKLDARIPFVGKVQFVEESCPTNITELEPYDKTLIITKHQCPSDSRFILVDEIKGSHPLYGYRAYKVKRYN